MSILDSVFTGFQIIIYGGLGIAAFYLVFAISGMRRFLFSGYVVSFISLALAHIYCLVGNHELSNWFLDFGKESFLPVSSGVILLLALDRFLFKKGLMLRKTHNYKNRITGAIEHGGLSKRSG